VVVDRDSGSIKFLLNGVPNGEGQSDSLKEDDLFPMVILGSEGESV
jgi:hypothetical protein